jgi:hypothetical protein
LIEQNAGPTQKEAAVKVRAFHVLGLLCVIWVSVSSFPCGRGGLESRIRRAEGKWRERGVESYRIVVSDWSLWHYQVHDIVVRNSSVA